MRTPLRVLSGGERGRLMLARALAKPSNVLVLDEPTNDLDLETLDVLEEMLGDYPGTVLLISHDRDFLDRVVSSRDRAGRQRQVGRVCRRLQRHAEAARRATLRGRRTARRRPRRRPGPKTAASCGPAAGGKRKLSFNEKHALETLPKTMTALQAEIARQQKLLDDPQLFAKDRKTFDAGIDGDCRGA